MNLKTDLPKLVALAIPLAILLAASPVSAQDDSAGTNAATNAEAPAGTNAVSAGTNAAAAKERPAALAAAMAAAAANPAPATNDTQDTRLDARSFSIIQTRNIFNPSRQAPRPARDNTPPPPRSEYFTLNGVMTYDDKGYAFFDGSSGQYRRTLAHADSIAGYKIAGISNNLVKLAASSNQTITMSIGMQMRRTGDGPWKLESRGESSSDATASGGSESNSDPTAVSPIFTGAQEDIAKKLIARRLEEEKKTGATNEDNKNDQNQ